MLSNMLPSLSYSFRGLLRGFDQRFPTFQDHDTVNRVCGFKDIGGSLCG